jgi:hypothetical protein
MIKVFACLWATVLCGLLFVPLRASAATNVDKAALRNPLLTAERK